MLLLALCYTHRTVHRHVFRQALCCIREADSSPVSEGLSLWTWLLGEFFRCKWEAQFSSSLSANSSFHIVLDTNSTALVFSEKDRQQHRGSRDGGDRRSAGSAQLPSLSLESRWIVEPSSCSPEAAGCAHTWTPPRRLHLQVLYHTSHCGRRGQCAGVVFLHLNLVFWIRSKPQETGEYLGFDHNWASEITPDKMWE